MLKGRSGALNAENSQSHTPLSCRGIAQGCSEYNITVLVDQQDSVRALRAVHGRFYLATLPLGVGIVGPGLVGKTFLAQIESQIKVGCNRKRSCLLCHYNCLDSPCACSVIQR